MRSPMDLQWKRIHDTCVFVYIWVNFWGKLVGKHTRKPWILWEWWAGKQKKHLQDMIAAAAEDPQESYEQLLGV